MNSQVTILDRNNQSILVDLISYFKLNNKNYIFYNKNEIVQDGLIKMYVSEQNNGISNDISQDEWNSLKKVMQGIITGNSSVEFIPYSNPVVFNEPKAIALNDTNINIIKTAYKNVVNVNAQEPVLNKDILTQNFGNNLEVSTNQVEQPVEISAIPNNQNNFNMEATPVNMNMEMPSIEQIGTVPEVPNIENPPVLEPVVEQNIQAVEPSLETSVNDIVQTQTIESVLETPVIDNNDMGALNINSIKPGGIDSGFKVSDEPNIFDNPSMPFSITEEEINNVNDNQVNEANDVKVFDEKKINNNKMIELNNRKIKLFEELANIYREENELLKGNNSTDLEKTASNLFDNNGSLNINEVLN